MSKGGEKIDPFTVTTNKEDHERFRKLDFFDQLDAAVNNASKPDMKNLPGFFIGMIWFCLHAIGCCGLTWYVTGTELWSVPFHEALLKNVIAWDSLCGHHGFCMFYRVLVGGNEFTVKHEVGSIKEPAFPSAMGRRRTMFDVLINVGFDLSRIWLLLSNEPSPLCAWAFYGTTALLYLFDFGEYVGLYGMYHGPWSVFILAKYYGGAQGPSTAMLQFMLQLLYIGCGLGKMGPWFVSVFNQEWTLPPWGKFLDLRPYLYKGDFPKDNTPSATGVALAYAAASSEWIAPLLMLCTSGVVGGEPGTMTPCVFAGIFIIIAMHFYINFHIAPFDVWMLNFTPAYAVYNVYYRSPHISEPGFDYAGFSELHPAFYWFCWFMAAYVAYGQMFPENMTYMHCYRFWAGNWPQAWVLVSKKGYDKLLASFPNQAMSGPPEGIFSAIQGPLWAFNALGMFQTSQLCHRYLPVAMHKALAHGAKERGDEMPSSLSDFQDNQGGFIGFGSLFFGWGAGYHVNDALRAKYFLGEFQERCKWEAGDCLLIEGSSFPVFASVTGAKSHWSITDAKMGLVEDGWVNTTETVAITRPSMLRNYSVDKKSK